MSRRSLRARLVGAAALAIVVAIGLLGLTLGLALDQRLHSSLDRTLRERAADVARLAASAPALLTTPGTLEAPLGGRQLSVEVLDRRGRILARSSSLGGHLLPGGALARAALSTGASGYRDARLDADDIRLYVAPLAEAGGPAAGGAVLVASSTREIDDTLRGLRVLIGLGAVVAAVLAALAAAVLTGRGLRPLRRLSAAASEIERTGDASRRLPAGPARDEVGELSRTLNAMLAALERARSTERRFLADASHELRTPLTSLRGNAAFVARHGADPAALADIERDAARLAALLEDLLALEREEGAASPRETVALDDVVRAAVAGAADTDVERLDPVQVRGEPAALERAVANLVENARVHGPAGGRITVALEERAGRALLSVRDEGPGLAPTERDAAFTRFWRGVAAAERPGTGLGLAIVRASAERHGGTVTADGARFTLELPTLRESSRTADTVPASSEKEGRL